MNNKRVSNNIVTHTGFSLFEVLMSLVILSCALLSLEALFSMSARLNQASLYKTLAVIQLHNLLEHHQAFKELNSLEEELDWWNESNRKILPFGNGKVSDQWIDIQWGRGRGLCGKIEIGSSGCLRIKR